MKEVGVVLTDQWCDWEASYVMAVMNSYTEDYTVKTISIDGCEKVSMGGIRAAVDYDMRAFERFDDMAVLVIPGGLSWEDHAYDEIAEFVSKVHEHDILVAAICGATTFLCRQGFLNDIKHTGDSREWFLEQKQYGYTGEALYQEKQVVLDGGFITANETAAVEFAYTIFKLLKIDTDEEIEEWYENFSKGSVRQ